MERSKFFVILLVVAVLIIVFVGVRALLGSGPLRPALAAAITAQATIIELGEQAATNSNNPELRNLAATVAVTTSSDRAQLGSYYQSAYNEAPPAAGGDAGAELEAASENFDAVFRSLVLEHLQAGRRQLETAHDHADNAELRTALEQAAQNHAVYIEQLGA